MRSFRDNQNRTWTLSITIGSVKKVKALLGLDLLDTEAVFTSTDVVQLVDVLYVLIKDQADKAGVTDEDFGSSLGGDVLNQAVEAFREEYVDFFPDPRLRGSLKKGLAKAKEADQKVLAVLDQTIDQRIDQQVTKFLKDFTDSQGSAE